jgi:G6PDH family F420-dependent oxidoreductase
MKLGYAIICEEHPPGRILEHARRAEAAGFDYLSISDHFHPWLDVQGESPFAWTVIGALGQVTDLPVVTAVTCPIHRYHPAVVAQAAATAACLTTPPFTLGLGSGEALNEHVVGGSWPSPSRRLDMLDEAITMIRELWAGEWVTHHGAFFTVDRARLYTLPDEPPRIAVAASGPVSARVAARHGDLVATGPDESLVSGYRDEGGTGQVWGQATLCFDEDPDRAAERLATRWHQTTLDWHANAEIPTPAGFAAAGRTVDRQDAVTSEPVGSDIGAIVDSLTTYRDAGFDAVALHNVGPDHLPFLEAARTELLTEARRRLEVEHTSTGRHA